MYNAKKKDRNTICRYTKEIDNTSVETLQLEYELLNAVKDNQFFLTYQPKVDASRGVIKGFEALIRWSHPRMGLIPPFQFIPLAEDTGKINEIGYWVFQQACEDMASWIEQGFTDIMVSINVSILQFKQPDLFEKMTAIMEKTGVPPSSIEIEVTETAVMENLEYVISTLHKFKQYGIKISVDDFGVGYSSLSYIKRFPIHTLKIDRSFVINITTDPDDKAIVAAIIAMAEAMNLSTIAEGVEEEAQLEILKELGCYNIQGYLFGKPVDYNETCKILDQEKSYLDASLIAAQNAMQLETKKPPSQQPAVN